MGHWSNRLEAYGWKTLLTAGIISLITACSTTSPVPTDKHALYRAAILDAAVVSPAKVSALQALPDTPTVNMVSWVTAARAPCKNAESPCLLQVGGEPLWVTLAGEVQSQCQTWSLRGDALRERLEQLLGLPPETPEQYRKVMFVVLEVKRENIQRPCLGTANVNGKPVCTITASNDTPVELRNFVGQQMAGSYVLDNPRGPGYPYTRLGYTYDWAVDAKPKNYGASEFLIKPGSSARVLSQTTTDEYCRAQP